MKSGNKGVVCFGELMLRLQSPWYSKLVQADDYEVMFTGAEANVGVSCVNFGIPAYAVSMVPDHDIGQACINFLRRYGLNTDYILRGGKRLGILYTETGYSQRPSKVIYDRQDSSFTEISISKDEWREILKDKCWFHFCGTAPAQGENAIKTLRNGLEVAKDMDLTVSVDYNFRSKLWSKAKANEIMSGLMEYVDIGIGNEEDCEAVFGIKAENTDFEHGNVDSGSYSIVARKMVQKFNLKYQAITLRESISADRNGWSAIIHDGENCYSSKRYEINLVDRIGGGDSFSGGLISSFIKGRSPSDAIEFAVAASCLKQTIPGDFNLVGEMDVLSLMGGNASGRVQR